jgi:PAS domain S-box-containing protein
VIDQAAEGICLIDADSKRILEANPEFQRMFGYTSEEVTELSIYDFVAHDRESVDRNVQLALEEGRPTVGERRCRRKDGALVDVMASGAKVACDPLPLVTGDQTQLAQLFRNLISNAIKFYGEQPPRIHLRAERQDSKWLFSTRDNGIEPQYAERTFVILQRLYGRTEYSRIGLAVCKKMVERHGGEIWVESEPGEGGTFFFTPSAVGKEDEVLAQREACRELLVQDREASTGR